ncbi:MAG: hypothetical protein D6696_19040 [Acidobacteria bacterium]|nr:MAG: hypothetical protein D6696_19040 [Acidobacteriota bacterium]
MLTAAMLALGMLACGLGGHPAVGTWRGGIGQLVTVSVYDDGIASFNSVKCRWQEVDGRTIRLELAEDDLETPLLVELRVASDGGKATINLGGVDVHLKRQEAGEDG